MSYGFRIWNGGKVVCDDEFPNLMASSKGTLSLSSDSTSTTAKAICNETGTSYSPQYYNEYRGELDRPTEGELLFFEVPQGRRVYAGYFNGGIQVWSTASSVRWVRAKFMRYLPAPATGSYGLFVRDAQGRYTYSSSEAFLLVKGTLMQGLTGQGAVWVAPSLHGFLGWSGDPQGIWFDQGCYNDGGTLRAQGRRGNTLLDSSVSVQQRVRGLVADIGWSEI